MTSSTAGAAEPGVVPDRATLDAKRASLMERLSSLDSLVIAYSGGVDSAFLACAAVKAMPGRLLAVTADSASYPRRHREIAEQIASQFNFPHEFMQTAELARPEYRANPANRCYYCKTELYEHLARLASDRGFAAIADGSNADDRGDYRPGRQAAREFGVISPLDEADLTKTEIRTLARELGMPTWDEPASACLSSRIPYKSEVTEAKLAMIEQAEDALRRRGFRVVRVRHHDTLARVELGRDELARAIEPEMSAAIVADVRAVGYQFVCLDLQGYRRGSLNEILTLRPI
jgi:uncharacterized protein